MKLRKDRIKVFHDISVSTRVYFRWATPADADREYLRWLQDPESRRWLSFASRTLPDLRRYVRSQVNNHKATLFIIHYWVRRGRRVQPASDFRIGTVKLVREDPQTVSLGLLIAPGWRHSGYGTEAIRLACAFARFCKLGRVTCGIHAENLASIKAFERAGFTVTPKIMGGSYRCPPK